MRNFRRLASVVTLIGIFSFSSFATTWFPKDFTCPIDNEKNTFLVIGSYGSYIYFWPSKYQWLFFPYTDSPAFYMCRKCHLTTYMWDFDDLPKDKIPALRKLLADVKVSRSFKDYQEIPVTERLEVMGQVYAVLEKDAEWRETFYRVRGYHYGQAGNTEKADEMRRKSLELIQAELKNEKSVTPKKLLLYMSASMKHFLRDDKGAIEDLNSALKTKYSETGSNAEKLKDAENGLNERINDYIAKINSDEKPRFAENPESKSDSGDDH